MTNNRDSYTAEQKDNAYRLYQAGKLSLGQIAKQTGIKYRTLQSYIKRRKANDPDDAKEKLEDVVVDNSRVIDSKGYRITTLDKLIEHCEIDLDEWIIEKHVINKWEVYGGKFGLKDLIQVKAWLTKRRPEAIQPVISPVDIHINKMRTVNKETAEYKKALLLCDAQVGFEKNQRSYKLDPFHDRKAIDITLQLCRKYSFDVIFICGDWLDNAMFSDKFQKKPAFYFCTQPALCEVAWILGQIRKLQPDARIIYEEGNHEVRLENMIISNFISGYGLRAADNIDGLAVMSIPNLLGLPSIGIEYIGNYPGGEYWLNDRAVVKHGDEVSQGSGATASKMAKKATYTEIFGHIHRFEWAVRTEHRNGKTEYIQSFSPGCLCRIDGAVPGKQARPNWQQGTAIIYFDEEELFIDPIQIKDGKAFYQGEIYKGVDYKNQLREDTSHHDKDGNEVRFQY